MSYDNTIDPREYFEDESRQDRRGVQPTEQFIITFTRMTGKPRFVCVEYDRTTGTYKHLPVPIGSARETRALMSPAWAAYGQIRDAS